MSSPSSPDIRKYGLEFINDLAQDRKEAVQSLGVAFSALKTEIRESAILTRSEEFRFVDDLMKHFREEVNRNFESQLTRITIKSLGWIKRVLMGEKILVKDESREEELQQIINDLSQQLKTKSAELSGMRPKIQTFEDQLKNKENEIQELKSTHMKQVQDLQQQVLSEKNRADNISMQHKNLQEEIFDFQLELEEQIKQTSALKEQNTQLDMDLVAAKGEISRLTSSLDQARSAVLESEEDVSAAMEQWTISYQQQEEYFQQNLKKTKEQYEEMIRTKLAESAEQHQKELNQLNEKLLERDSRVQDFQDQISELKMENQDLSIKREEIELLMDQLSHKFEESERVVIEQNRQINQLEIELEETRKKAIETERKKLHLMDIQLSQVRSRADWLEQCLSYSNFAPLTILLRMGDEMDLDSLAKSVGMDPIVLDNQLQMLVRRDLVEIGRDGMIRANIPTLVKEEGKDSNSNEDLKH